VGYPASYSPGFSPVPELLYGPSIDRQGPWRVRSITLPLLTPTTFFVLVISIINALQVFDAVLVLTDGGPANATRTMVYHIWQQGFVFLEMGYAAAVDSLLFVSLLTVRGSCESVGF